MLSSRPAMQRFIKSSSTVAVAVAVAGCFRSSKYQQLPVESTVSFKFMDVVKTAGAFAFTSECDRKQHNENFRPHDQDETHKLLTVAKNFLDYKHESVSRGDIEGVKIAEQLFELTLTELLRRLEAPESVKFIGSPTKKLLATIGLANATTVRTLPVLVACRENDFDLVIEAQDAQDLGLAQTGTCTKDASTYIEYESLVIVITLNNGTTVTRPVCPVSIVYPQPKFTYTSYVQASHRRISCSLLNAMGLQPDYEGHRLVQMKIKL